VIDSTLEQIKQFSNDQYGNEKRLNARIQLYRFSRNKISWREWLFNQLELLKVQNILEIGCGNGILWQENINKIPAGAHIVLTDVSPGMVNAARETFGTDRRFECKVLDANQPMPFGSGSFQMVLASHMLYHVDNKAMVFSEIDRVLSPEGTAYATTASVNTMGELDQAAVAFNRSLSISMAEFLRSFNLENGGHVLKKYFTVVEKAIYRNAVFVADVESLILYLASCYDVKQLEILTHNIGEFRHHLATLVNNSGKLKITSKAGLFKFKRKDAG